MRWRMPSRVWWSAWMDWAGVWLPILELAMGLLSFGLMLRFMGRFWALPIYHASFRRTFIGSNFILSFCPIFHAFTVIVFADRNPIQDQDYQYAIFQYSVYFVTHIALTFLHLKFIIFGTERFFAFIRRATYEYEKNNMPLILVASTCMTSLVLILAKMIVFMNVNPEDTMDDRLRKTLTVTESPVYFVMCYVVFAVSVVSGIMTFYCLLHKSAKLRHSSITLSERYEIQQTERIARIMLPILVAYVVAGCFGFPTLAIVVKQAFWYDSDPMVRKTYKFGVQMNYAVISAYNLYGTVYTLGRFGMFGKRLQVGVKGRCNYPTYAQPHFRYLDRMWRAGLARSAARP